MINKCFHSWSVTSKVHIVVRDNRSNFVVGLRDAGIPNIPCLDHTLQLVAKDQCLAQPAVVDLTAKAFKLVWTLQTVVTAMEVSNKNMILTIVN